MTYLPICIRVIFYFMKRVNSSWNAVLELLNSSVIVWKGHYIAFVLLKWFLGPSINYKFNKSIYCLFVWIYGFVMIKNRLKLPFCMKQKYLHASHFFLFSFFICDLWYCSCLVIYVFCHFNVSHAFCLQGQKEKESKCCSHCSKGK